MTQERPNIFTQKVANLEPGKRIDVDIRYFHTLAYVDGVYEFVAPLVVGPRFNPPGSTGGIEAVARDASATAGPGTQIPYLAPGERSGHDVSVEVTLDAGVALTAVESPSHAVTVNRPSPHQATIQLRASDTIPNRDFILRYRVDSDRLKAGFLTHTDPRGGFFTLMLYPPAEVEETARRPLEMIFVIDCSGSMEGWPLARTRMAMARALHGLSPEDAYQIIRFSDDAHRMHQDLIPATPGNIRRDLEALDALRSSGGTMMTRGLRAALTTRHDPERLRVVTLLTDGFIGNEIEVLRVMRTHLGEARVFSFGVGNSVNRYLMEAMARLGRGAVAYVGQDGSVQQAVDRFFQRVRCPRAGRPDHRLEGHGGRGSIPGSTARSRPRPTRAGVRPFHGQASVLRGGDRTPGPGHGSTARAAFGSQHGRGPESRTAGPLRTSRTAVRVGPKEDPEPRRRSRDPRQHRRQGADRGHPAHGPGFWPPLRVHRVRGRGLPHVHGRRPRRVREGPGARAFGRALRDHGGRKIGQEQPAEVRWIIRTGFSVSASGSGSVSLSQSLSKSLSKSKSR